MNILFIASEVTPLIKVGGLADVVGALPPALQRLGHDVRILLPRYSLLPASKAPIRGTALITTVPWKGRRVRVVIHESLVPTTNTPLYLMSAPQVFDGDAVYYEHSGPDGARFAEERYAFFSWAAAHVVPKLRWQPTILHCHDWHTGFIPALLRLHRNRYRTIFTIHNMEGQGKWRAEEVFSWLGLRGHEHRALEIRDIDNNLNLLQLGIRSSDIVTTVSPTYANEISSAQYGVGLERDVVTVSGGVQGIVNGIDTTLFNPATDQNITAKYTSASASVGKIINKRALVHELGLPNSDGPLFGLVGRLTSQKGVDLVANTIDDFVAGGAQVVILGSGVPEIESLLTSAVQRHPRHAHLTLRFDAGLAQRIYAASDFFLMPSRFEPCGLGQLIAMRYGALPIVRDTGGLHDTVRDIRHTTDGTGLLFSQPTVTEFSATLQAALRLWNEHDTLVAARQRAMNEDVSWNKSALLYDQLYTHAK